MVDVDADHLLPNEQMRQGALDGDISHIHRGDQYAAEGDTFTIDDTTFEVTEITERTLGDLTDEDAKQEGFEDLDAYRRLLERAHDHFEWDDESEIVRHRFEQR